MRKIEEDIVGLVGVGKGGSAPLLRLPTISYANLRFCWDFPRSMVAAERLSGDARPQPVPNGSNEEKSNRNFEAERFTCLEPQMPIPALLRHKPRYFSLDQWQESGVVDRGF